MAETGLYGRPIKRSSKIGEFIGHASEQYLWAKDSMGRSLASTSSGRAFKQGVGESFGFVYGEAGQSHGFLGLKKSFGQATRQEWIKDSGRALWKSGVKGNAWKTAAKRGIGSKMMWARGGGALMLGMMAHDVYSGYQEEGLYGAAKGFGSSALTWGVMKAAAAAVGGVTLGVAAVGVGAVAGGYEIGEASQAYAKRMRGVEMGAPVVDPYGSIATTRQRSLAALQNTHINGRMAMGNEGVLMHDNAYSFRR